MKKAAAKNLILEEIIGQKILLIRGKKVILDKDLAQMYGVATKSLNLSVKRNRERFPDDFMFQLSKEENENLRFQSETSKRGGRRYLPYAFTEHGILMLSSVLKSEHAIQVNIAIMRVFVNLKEMIAGYKQLVSRLSKLEEKIKKHDKNTYSIFELIRQLMTPLPEKPKKRIGFRP